MNRSVWRDASMTPSLFGIPCIAYTPIFLWLFHIRWWTLYTAIGIIVLFGVLRRFGLTYTVIWHKFAHLLRGSRIYARPWWYRNRFIDRS